MSASVVLLRGVNVGRSNRIAMADLRTALERAGCRDVRTYVQSGNAVVQWDGGIRALEQAVRAELAAGGLDVPVMARTAAELGRVVDACPWQDLDPKLLHVGFLAGPLDPAVVEAVDHEALLPERLAVGDGVVYLDYAAGVHRSRGLDRLRLGVDLTARNWRTVTTLRALADG